MLNLFVLVQVLCYNINMINECKNCGGNVFFSPKDKGNVCENCGSVFSVKYDNNVVKKDFAEAKKLNDIA